MRNNDLIGLITLPSSLSSRIKRWANDVSRVNWVFPSGFQFTAAASLVGVAGLLFAIKDGKLIAFDVLPRSLNSDDAASRVVPGLRNLGNNCFLNVILQSLASCSSFRRFIGKTIEGFEGSLSKETVENLPLTAALALLLEDLCTLQHGRLVLSPRDVMLAMNHYIPNFDLMTQQDAEEAFFLLLSALREELSEVYVSGCSSLADITALSNSRILGPKERVGQSEQDRWRRSFLGPFDGILSSNLTCQSCSVQISLDLQLFNSLYLAPPLSSSATIMTGCSVEDCLRKFFTAERVENYFCNNCWHIAAAKYLSVFKENKMAIEKVEHCKELDSCDCKNLSCLGALPWSSSFSRTFKKLSIGRSPKILCIHLGRASANVFGQSVKLKGHISYPMTLDLSEFTMNRVRPSNQTEYLQKGREKQQSDISIPANQDLMAQLDTGARNCNLQAGRSMSSQEAGGSSAAPCERHVYHLVSVVRHFGRVGSGHYIVYRRANARVSDESPAGLLGSSFSQWFCISDTEVHSVTEEEVLSAEASILFYEKI